MNLLDNVQVELQSIKEDDLIEPGFDIDPEVDTEVGEATLDLKKIYTLQEKFQQLALKHAVDARCARTDGERKAAMATAIEFREKSELIGNFFWACLKDEFGLWLKPSVGIRKGWKVVWSTRPPRIITDLLDLLNRQGG